MQRFLSYSDGDHSYTELITLNKIMALISTEENTEFEVPKSFVSCLGSKETATCLYL